MINTNNNGLANLGLNNQNTHYIKREVSLQNMVAAQSPRVERVENPQELLDFDKFEQKRQTYGLAILELMSDQEYQAWLRATAGMTETEKMLAVQKLYPLADIDRIKSAKAEAMEKISRSANLSSPESSESGYIINANKLNGMRVFSADSNFIQRYKNAYDSIEQAMQLQG
ncbi:hypothetical protein DCO58_04555 [Helicobacter saguini]|uniref:Uncharacterized protein n=1 Tax=Helicobacter saguini TaxID=1548018 RepID=A0A347VST2_9HELI|nr:hypothetical protein [Helicobacter saguini]MWV62375.1 hypothetical protein [Helicobacter saguini]MWV66953.1 hypothetical protein [Helicobacter saguini]MWV69301.1 hypothetical protein [Helicobacter saguini]MWV71143.1 hypothetical protein [Helicobacter saguini]TLD94966.1 hypothetical protein LS64_003325 [Helicobacter saguini]